MKQKWPVRLAAGVLAVGVLSLAALAAGTQGSQTDPLVSLSYLTGTFTSSILEQVDEKLDSREEALTQQLQAAAEGSDASGGTYEVVTLSQGQTLTAGTSCEILLRSGTAVCVSDSSPGLVDMTAASTLANGGALTANHLYLATIEGRGVSASTAVTLMVRGNYTIQ